MLQTISCFEGFLERRSQRTIFLKNRTGDSVIKNCVCVSHTRVLGDFRKRENGIRVGGQCSGTGRA